MHHISGGHWHFITVELYFGPTECIWSGEEGLSPPAPPAATAAFLPSSLFKRARTDIAILIKVTKRVLNHI